MRDIISTALQKTDRLWFQAGDFILQVNESGEMKPTACKETACFRTRFYTERSFYCPNGDLRESHLVLFFNHDPEKIKYIEAAIALFYRENAFESEPYKNGFVVIVHKDQFFRSHWLLVDFFIAVARIAIKNRDHKITKDKLIEAFNTWSWGDYKYNSQLIKAIILNFDKFVEIIRTDETFFKFGDFNGIKNLDSLLMSCTHPRINTIGIADDMGRRCAKAEVPKILLDFRNEAKNN